MLSAMCLDSQGRSIYHLTQWDTNQKLIIEDEYSVGGKPPTVHFCNKNSEIALGVASEISNGKIVADIPNMLLEEPYNIIAYIFVVDSVDVKSGKTVETINIPVRPRPKPSDYVFTDNVDVIYLSDLIAQVEQLKKDMNNLAIEVKSYVVGGTSTREGEDTDNAMYYYRQSKKNADDSLVSANKAKSSETSANVHSENAANSASQALESATDAQGYADEASRLKDEVSEIIENSLLEDSGKILKQIEDYFKRAEELYRSCTIICDGEIPQRRVCTIVEIDCHTPQRRATGYKGIEFDGGTPGIRLLGE